MITARGRWVIHPLVMRERGRERKRERSKVAK